MTASADPASADSRLRGAHAWAMRRAGSSLADVAAAIGESPSRTQALIAAYEDILDAQTQLTLFDV